MENNAQKINCESGIYGEIVQSLIKKGFDQKKFALFEQKQKKLLKK